MQIANTRKNFQKLIEALILELKSIPSEVIDDDDVRQTGRTVKDTLAAAGLEVSAKLTKKSTGNYYEITCIGDVNNSIKILKKQFGKSLPVGGRGGLGLWNLDGVSVRASARAAGSTTALKIAIEKE